MLPLFRSIACLFLLLSFALSPLRAKEGDRPNVLWIVFEDISPNLGCYGDSYAVTPNLDRFAKESSRYTRVWSNGCACSPARSTLITGMYASSLGVENQRSRGVLPEFVRPFTEYLREAGYYCSNHAKTDYNFERPPSAWDASTDNWQEHGWSRREDGQPFFSVINFKDTHSSQIYWRGEKNWIKRREALAVHERHDPALASVPPYYPDTPEVRQDLSRYYDNVTYADRLFQQVLDRLEADGLAEETIVFFFSDHGRGMPRGKSWCFDSSLRVPLMIRFPEKYAHLAPSKAGGTVDELVGFVDFAPTLLALGGVEAPEHLQGRAFLGTDRSVPKRYLYGYRGRMDDRYDMIRAVSDGRYHYIRNYMPHLPWYHKQTREYPKLQPSYQVWHRMAKAGQLSGSSAIFMAERKPLEELYDLETDPHQVRNLAASDAHGVELKRMRAALRERILEIKDLGFMPELQRAQHFGDADARLSHYEIVRERPQVYPLQRILETADWVGSGSGALAGQVKRLRDDDPAVRFWSSVGLLAQGEAAGAARDALTQALGDSAPTVRIAAAQALAELGDTDSSFPVLLDALNDPRSYVSLRAANALDHLGDRIRPIASQVLAPLKLEPDEAVYNSHYPQRVLRTIEERFNGDGQ